MLLDYKKLQVYFYLYETHFTAYQETHFKLSKKG